MTLRWRNGCLVWVLSSVVFGCGDWVLNPQGEDPAADDQANPAGTSLGPALPGAAEPVPGVTPGAATGLPGAPPPTQSTPNGAEPGIPATPTSTQSPTPVEGPPSPVPAPTAGTGGGMNLPLDDAGSPEGAGLDDDCPLAPPDPEEPCSPETICVYDAVMCVCALAEVEYAWTCQDRTDNVQDVKAADAGVAGDSGL